jgi:hypothetical protein
MEKINTADKEIAYPQNENILVLQGVAGIPDNYKNAAGNDNTEKLGYSVEKEVINLA